MSSRSPCVTSPVYVQEMLLSEITSVLLRYCASAQPNFNSASASTSTPGGGSSNSLVSLASLSVYRDRDSFSGATLSSAPSSVADNFKALLPFPPAAPPVASSLKSAFATTLDLTRAPLTRSGSGNALDRSMSLSSAANALSSTGTWSMNKLFSGQAKEDEKPVRTHHPTTHTHPSPYNQTALPHAQTCASLIS